ncbi:hypothetical protein SARC_11144 [Sphaeroforma arctica JP610]|uniref:Uncharacterized protein n=1 Tax=Sphaeroforma arctica JP610 TaxID=667725 RepID=A0A0L0FIP4_9EUKA|nr:hypothetical protein SARC_11144 [Sphaeroforma arctica JP610]KNC76351.1 hypothetical protein SARC_11144 [Sphaeroforma arctica JP610]|eukprot:XP_014150253.1 hypothetical protein SARC_11144 [Sphaeroforma arctica JP610]
MNVQKITFTLRMDSRSTLDHSALSNFELSFPKQMRGVISLHDYLEVLRAVNGFFAEYHRAIRRRHKQAATKKFRSMFSCIFPVLELEYVETNRILIDAIEDCKFYLETYQNTRFADIEIKWSMSSVRGTVSTRKFKNCIRVANYIVPTLTIEWEDKIRLQKRKGKSFKVANVVARSIDAFKVTPSYQHSFQNRFDETLQRYIVIPRELRR